MGSIDTKRVPALAAAKRKRAKRPAATSKGGRGRKRPARKTTKKKHVKKVSSKKLSSLRSKRTTSTRKTSKDAKKSKKRVSGSRTPVKSKTAKRKRVGKRHTDTKVRPKRSKVRPKHSKETRKTSTKTSRKAKKKPTKVAKKKRSLRKSPRKSHEQQFIERKQKFLEQIKEAKEHESGLSDESRAMLLEGIEDVKAGRVVPLYKVDAGDVRGYAEHGGAEKFMHSSHANRNHPEEVLKDVFENAFIYNLKKGPFEADEVNIYRYGVLIRPREGIATEKLTDRIREIMSQYPGSSIHVITEGNTFSIRLNFGNNRRSELAGNVSADLQNNSGIIGDVYSLLEDRFGVTDWFAFWETEDAMYE